MESMSSGEAMPAEGQLPNTLPQHKQEGGLCLPDCPSCWFERGRSITFERIESLKEELAHEVTLKNGWHKLADTLEAKLACQPVPTELRAAQSYSDWALKLIAIIAEEKRLNTVVRLEEIKCATRQTDAYRQNFDDGDSPEDAWAGEMGAIEDSQ